MELPYSKEAEQKFLACLMHDENARIDYASKITDYDLYFNKHKMIFRAIYKIENSPDREVDLVTVTNELQGQIDNIASYLTQITRPLASAAGAESYANIIKEKSIRRQMIKTAEKMSKLATNQEEDITKLMAKAEEMLFKLNDKEKADRTYINVKDFATEHLEEIFTSDPDEEITGLRTPFQKLNKITGGLQGSELTLIAGQSGMGKTTLGLNIARHIAIEEEEEVGVFSLEMAKKKLFNRMLAEMANVNYMKLKRCTTNDQENQKIKRAASKFYDLETFNVNDTGGLTIEEIRSDARKMKKKEDIKLALVDYAGLITGGQGETEALRLQKIARSLRNMAKELDIHVILLVQINRTVSSRNDKRPKMTDLKGSSGLEQAADLILLLYRESEYNDEFLNDPELRKVTEILMDKNRENDTGKFLLEFTGQYYKFEDVHPELGERYMNKLAG